MPYITLFGNLRRLAGVTQAQAGGATVRQAIETLCANNAALRDAILQDDALRSELIFKGFSLLKHFDWKTIAKNEWVNIMQSLKRISERTKDY